MGDAYTCDDCDEFFEGTPDERIFRKAVFDTSILIAELCQPCADRLYESVDYDGPGYAGGERA